MLINKQYYDEVIPGEYAIIYTRPVGQNFGESARSALLDPNMGKYLRQSIQNTQQFSRIVSKANFI